jgi:hypothetical protein
VYSGIIILLVLIMLVDVMIVDMITIITQTNIKQKKMLSRRWTPTTRQGQSQLRATRALFDALSSIFPTR